jgi:hypothetical protein
MQLFEALQNIPGFDKTKLHKPKTPSKVRISCISEWLPTKDAFIPIFFHTLDRFFSKIPAGNDAERKVYSFLKELDKKAPTKIEALRKALSGFKQLGKREKKSLFVSDFLNVPIDKQIDMNLAAGMITNEIKVLGNRKVLYDTGTFLPAGLARPWTAVSSGFVSGEEFGTETLPFPYICSVNGIHPPGYLDKSAPGTPIFQDSDFEFKCEPIINVETGEVNPNCTIKVASDGCEGGDAYSPFGPDLPRHSPCLRVPSTRAGAGS